MVEWELDAPFTQELLNHPTINVAVEPDTAGVHGIRTGRDRKTIDGAGRVVGVKFRPGAFQPFYGRSLHQLTNRVVPLAAVFGPAGDALAAAVRAEPERPFAVMEEFLRARRPPPDPHLDTLAAIVRTMLEDPAVVRVDELAARHAMSPRTLQRLFRRYVGVSPKWVLQRYRLHEAAERIAEGRDGVLGGDRARARLLRPGALHPRLQGADRRLAGAVRGRLVGAEDAVARVAQARGGCSRARRARGRPSRR